MTRIALIGADGQLGTDLFALLKAQNDVKPLYYPDFDITRYEEIERILSKLNPEIVINTAAFNKVDECEKEPTKAFDLNTFAVRNLAQICKELDFDLIHFSSDYVFNGEKGAPYVEDDTPNPLNAYGVSKLAGEYFIQSILERFFLIRTCGLYGEAGCWGKGYNFVDTMISLAKKGETIHVVDDQWITPTSTQELAERVGELLQTKSYGLYHLTNEGSCTWFEFASQIFSYLHLDPQLSPVDSKTFGSLARRPSYSVLENKKAKKINLTEFSSWKIALKDYLKRKGYF